jgi:hypothetical protein
VGLGLGLGSIALMGSNSPSTLGRIVGFPLKSSTEDGGFDDVKLGEFKSLEGKELRTREGVADGSAV